MFSTESSLLNPYTLIWLNLFYKSLEYGVNLSMSSSLQKSIITPSRDLAVLDAGGEIADLAVAGHY